MGLGLAVARGFVSSIGGELMVEDTPGGGCTMVVSLPLDPIQFDAASCWSTTTCPCCGRSRSASVPAATSWNVARTGEEALDCAAHRHPDVILLDLGLPTIDGIDVIRGLRG